MKVFLSSTAQDLGPYRQVADDTILRLSQQAVAMERFGPLSGEPVAECERKARESDVLVCIVAHRYGWVPEKGRGSITRREVEAAKAAGKGVLAWIVADDHPWTEKKEQDLLTDPTVFDNPTRVAEVVEAVKALAEFKGWLRATFVCETFTTPDDLGRKIAIGLKYSAAELEARKERLRKTRRAPRSGHRGRQEAPHVFISYLRTDRAVVGRLAEELRSNGIEVWLDRERLLPGQKWKKAIRTAIQTGTFFIACFSREYLDRARTYMNEELLIAIEELRLRGGDQSWFIPVLLSGSESLVPDYPIGPGETLRDLQWAELSSDWTDGIERIVFAIKSARSERR